MNNDRIPEVSIITAAYNSEKYIAETIESVLGQTFTDWEYIIIDDGSNDNTNKIIKKYADDKRIKYVYQENQKQAMARNNAFKISNGKYIAILDADDTWAPTKLEKQVELMKKTPNVGLIYTNWQRIDENGCFLKTTPVPDITADPLRNQIIHNTIPFSSFLIRKSCINRELHNEKYLYTGDCYLTIKITLNGHSFGYINEKMLYYRVHKKAISYKEKCTKNVFNEQIMMLAELSNDPHFPPKHKVYFKKAYSMIHIGQAFKLIKYGGKLDRSIARQLLTKSIKYSKHPKILYKIIKQFVKSYIYPVK